MQILDKTKTMLAGLLARIAAFFPAPARNSVEDQLRFRIAQLEGQLRELRKEKRP